MHDLGVYRPYFTSYKEFLENEAKKDIKWVQNKYSFEFGGSKGEEKRAGRRRWQILRKNIKIVKKFMKICQILLNFAFLLRFLTSWRENFSKNSKNFWKFLCKFDAFAKFWGGGWTAETWAEFEGDDNFGRRPKFPRNFWNPLTSLERKKTDKFSFLKFYDYGISYLSEFEIFDPKR